MFVYEWNNKFKSDVLIYVEIYFDKLIKSIKNRLLFEWLIAGNIIKEKWVRNNRFTMKTNDKNKNKYSLVCYTNYVELNIVKL
jgi:hypothetical protein